MQNEDGNETRQEWGMLTGWRMIAQEVMKGLEEDTTNQKHKAKSIDESFEPQDDSEISGIILKNRLKSVKAKKGENFYMDYQMEEEIGSGAFGRAIKAKRKSNQEVVVVKELLGKKMSQKEVLETKNEVKVLAHLNHPNVVKYYDFYADSGKMHIVMEYCQEGDLSAYLKSRNGALLEENEIMMKFVQICLALHHIHDQGILHRDLKSQNIFLSIHDILKLGDFGISRVMDNENAMARSMVGTPYYLSPEICEDKPYGSKSDVWSLGCVLYELCTLKHAFDGQSLPALVLKILSGNIPEVPSKYSNCLESLVQKLLCKHPDVRPSVAEILNFDYVREHLQHFAAHIHFSVERRRDSFQRSLEPFNLSDQALAFEKGFSQRKSTSHSFVYNGHDQQRHSSIRKDNFNLNGWEEYEEDNGDEDTFEISPYRLYTKDEEESGLRKLNLRSTQTELQIIPESPLSAELAAANSKIEQFKVKIFGIAAKKKPQDIATDEEVLENKILTDEYITDEEGSEATTEDGTEDDHEPRILFLASKEQHVPQVVAQIQDIMKHPSTQLEAGQKAV